MSAAEDRPAFIDQLNAGWDQGKFVCVGLDSEFSKLPPSLVKTHANDRFASQLRFNMAIVDATHDLVLAYKPNIAFYEDSHEGETALEETVDYIHDRYPDIPVIVDAKRGDIANTNIGYARSVWDRYGFDATTVHSYLGSGTYPSFLEQQGKGIIAMCKTSNPDAFSIQDLAVDLNFSKLAGALTEEEYSELKKLLKSPKVTPLYAIMAYRHEQLRRKNPNIGVVVGATQVDSFSLVRTLFDGPILIPGIGTQGGDLEGTLRYAPDSNGQGMIINSSRGIIFASSGEDFAEAARAATFKLHSQITEIRRAV